MKNKKLILAVVALVAVIGLLLGVYSATRPKTRGELAAQKETPAQTEVKQPQEQPEQQTEEQTEQQTEATEDTVTVTVIVVHKDGSEKEFTVTTAAYYLGEILLSEGIVEGEVGPYGLMISAADGEVADWNVDQSYWAIFIGEEYATTGADGIPLFDGDVYKLVYTIG